MGLILDIIKSKRTLTDKLLDIVSDFDIYCEFTEEDLDFKKTISSPLRDDDTFPSFSIFVPTEIENPREEEIWWKDFSRGWSGDVFRFVQRYADFNFGVTLETRYEIIKFIDNELELELFSDKKIEYTRRNVDMIEGRKRTSLEYISRKFTRLDLYWWALRGIDQQLLVEHSVESVKTMLNEKFYPYYTFSQYEICMSLVVGDVCKIYRPTANREDKWRSCIPSGNKYFFGIRQCRRKDVLIITKSLKDIMSFKSFMKCDAIAPQAETITWDPEFLERQRKRYKIVYVVMDYDEAGISASNTIVELQPTFKQKWVSMELNPKTGKPDDKDISDYIFNHDFTGVIEKLMFMFPELPTSFFKPDRVDYFIKLTSKYT